MFFDTHKIDRRYMQLIDTIDINTCILFRVCSRYLVVCRYYTSGGTDYCGCCCCCCCCYCCCCCCCCYCPYCYCCVPLPSLGGTICCTRHYCCFVVVAVGFASGPGWGHECDETELSNNIFFTCVPTSTNSYFLGIKIYSGSQDSFFDILFFIFFHRVIP